MQITIGIYAIILVFFLLVIPGFLLRRAYYSGEFSKEINWSKNTFSNFISSLIIGIFLTCFCILLYNNSFKKGINFDFILNLFDKFFYPQKEDESNYDRFNGFTETFVNDYLPFIILTYFVSFLLGFILNKIVILFDLDIKLKLLRFANSWHYFTSGRILKQKKIDSPKDQKKLRVKYTWLDILVSEKGDKTTLYSGLCADYDLSFDDINKLEKIYLLKPLRYKKISDGTTVTKEIPGKLFLIMGSNILNINATYICYNEDENKLKTFPYKKNIILSLQILSILIYSLFLILFILKVNFLNSYYFEQLLHKSWIYKILFIFTLNILFGVLVPVKINNEKREIDFIGWMPFWAMILVLLISSILLCFFYTYN